MAKRKSMEKSCRSKDVFESAWHADKEAKFRNVRFRGKIPELHSYECRVCGKFHLTSSTRENFTAPAEFMREDL